MFFLIFIFSLISVINTNRLLSVVVIHRHGDRNPFTTYKTDPYADESNWPEGLGQLTKIGIQRQYDLGLWLNNRYSSLLPERYSPRVIRAISTDVDRTLMSAEVTLAGFYPPLETDRINENLNWQPIPIHTKPKIEDPLLAMKKLCNKHKQLLTDLLESPQIKEIDDINKNLYSFLSNKSGEIIRNVYDVEIIHNTIHTQFLSNKTLPEWTAEVYPDKMKPAVILRYKLPCYTKELARLKTGLLFGEILKNFRNFIDGNDGRKVLLFSGHDSTLANILTSIGAFNDEIPPYSSAILFELYQDQQERFFVNTLFKNITGLYNINLENCEFNCDFVKFSQILEPIVIPDLAQWDKECEN